MNSNVRFIPSSKLSKAELPFVLTPDECIDIFSRVRNPNDILKSLPNELSQRISLSAKKSTSGLLKSMEAELVKVDWIAVSNSPRRGALSDAQINRYPKLKTYIQSVIYTGKTKVNKASYQPVTDDVVLPKDYIYVPSDPIPENKIVVEVAGQSPASNAAFYLSKSNDLSAKITQAKPDKKVSHRSLVKFEQLESVPRDLYLHIKMQGHPNPLSLRLAEGIMPVSKETEMAEWDNVLVPVRPLAYLNEEKSKSKSAELKAGYLYIFWKGKLWRELFITDKSYYQDIDVEYFRHLEQQEKNKQNPQPITRYPEGFDQQHVLLPYKIKGELQQGENGLKLLFRPQALTFAQIEKFEQDSAKLDKESTALDDINTYSVEQSFSDKNHILGVSSAQIHEVSEKDMPWLSDNAVVVDSLKDTNIAVAYVDGHNSGLRVELKTLGKYPIPEADFLIQFEDGTSQQERLDEEGFHFFESIPEGEFTITYSDYDDVYVKSVAAHICDAIKHRNKSKTFRLLSQSTEAIPMIVEAYDKYFNNNQGNGLVKDILHLFTRPNIRVAVIGLLVAGGVDVGGGETYYPPEATQNTILAIQAQPALSTVIKDSVLKLKLNRQRAIVESTKAYSEYKWFIAHSQQAIKDEGAPPLAYLGKDIDIEFKPEFYGQHIIMCRHQYHSGDGSTRPAEYYSYPINVGNAHSILAPDLEKAKDVIQQPETSLIADQRYIDTLKQIADNTEMDEEATEKHEEELEKLETNAERLRDLLEDSAGKTRYPIKAVAISTDTHAKQPLKAFLYQKRIKDNWFSDDEHVWGLVDWTYCGQTAFCGEYEGTGRNAEEAISNALKDWESNSQIAESHISYEVDIIDNNQAINLKGDLKTSGGSSLDTAIEWSSNIALGATAVTLIFAPVPGSRVASAAIWASIATSTTASALSIYQRYDKGFSNVRDDGLDTLAIVGNIFGAGWLRQSSLNFSGTNQGLKAGKYLLYGQVAADGASAIANGVVLTTEAMDQIDAIKVNSSLTPSEKTRQIAELIRSLSLAAGLTVLNVKGNKDDLAKLKAGKPDTSVEPPSYELKGQSSNKAHQSVVEPERTDYKVYEKDTDGTVRPTTQRLDPDLLERIEIAKKHAYEYAKEIDQNWIGGKGEKGLQPAQGAKKPKMVSVIVTKDRQIFKAYNTRRGNPHFEPHPLVHVDDRVKNAYDNLDEELKKRPTHGMCAEVYTTHKTLSAEADLDGAVSVAVHLDDFTFRDACESCFPAIKSFGIFDGIKME